MRDIMSGEEGQSFLIMLIVALLYQKNVSLCPDQVWPQVLYVTAMG